jgi:hypothetical protein
MAIAHLPVVVVRTAYQELTDSPLLVEHPTLTELSTYYANTWLNGEYELRMWNVNEETTRTNNSVEGWHHRLNKAVGRVHPNVLDLVENLIVEQSATDSITEAARLGQPPPPRRRRYRDNDERLARLREDLTSGRINSSQFLAACRHTVQNF